MRQEGEGVERVVGGEGDMLPNGGQSMSKKALLISVGISVVVAFFMVSLYFMPQLVSKTDFTANTQSIAKDIGDLKTSVATLSALSTQIANLSNNIGSINSELAGIRGSIAGYATQGSLSTLQTSLATIQADLNTVKISVADIPSLKTQVATLQSSLDSLKAQVTALDARVVKLETTTTTTTSTTTTQLASDTLNGVTASIEPYSYFINPINPIFGTTTQTIAVTTNGTSDGTTTFQLVIENKTTATIKDLVLALSFGVVNSSGNPQNVTTTGITLSSQGLIPQWTPQPTGIPSIFSYYGGSFGVFNFSQAVGDRSYVCNIVFSPVAGLSHDTTYYLYPQIKVVSFTK